jgi:hypothetical protein
VSARSVLIVLARAGAAARRARVCGSGENFEGSCRRARVCVSGEYFEGSTGHEVLFVALVSILRAQRDMKYCSVTCLRLNKGQTTTLNDVVYLYSESTLSDSTSWINKGAIWIYVK